MEKNSDTDIPEDLVNVVDRPVVFKPDCISESPGELPQTAGPHLRASDSVSLGSGA